ncbi:MAG: hypothetical protein ACO3XN_07970, partial [Chthoniobacterales bacterium]
GQPAPGNPRHTRWLHHAACTVLFAVLSLSAVPLHAATCCRDDNDAADGFGTAAGTWADPTTNGATHGRTTRCP